MKMEDRISEQRHSARTISTPKHLRSSVWKYFGFYAANGKITTKNKAVCRLCTKQLTYSSTTTNLRSHLQACHRSETAEAPQATGATLQPYVTASCSVHSASADPLPETCKSDSTGSLIRIIVICFMLSLVLKHYLSLLQHNRQQTNFQYSAVK